MGMSLPPEIEQRAFRDSFIMAQKMKDFDAESRARKAGLRWWHDFTLPAWLILSVGGFVGCLLWVAYSLFGILR